MFVALWEYEVKPSCEERFQKAYGPEGNRAKLFRSDGNYLENEIVARCGLAGNLPHVGLLEIAGDIRKIPWSGMLRNTRP